MTCEYYINRQLSWEKDKCWAIKSFYWNSKHCSSRINWSQHPGILRENQCLCKNCQRLQCAVLASLSHWESSWHDSPTSCAPPISVTFDNKREGRLQTTGRFFNLSWAWHHGQIQSMCESSSMCQAIFPVIAVWQSSWPAGLLLGVWPFGRVC